MGWLVLADVKSRLDISGTSYDALVQDSLDWAEGFVADRLDYQPVAAAGTHYYRRDSLDPTNRKRLILDEPLVGVISLQNGDTAGGTGTTITAAEYVLEPRNASPKDAIRLLSGTSWTFDTDGEIVLAGSFGGAASADGQLLGIGTRLAEWHYRSKNLNDATTIFSEQTVVQKQPGFPTEVLDQLDARARLR